jgi:hypothetical protein
MLAQRTFNDVAGVLVQAPQDFLYPFVPALLAPSFPPFSSVEFRFLTTLQTFIDRTHSKAAIHNMVHIVIDDPPWQPCLVPRKMRIQYAGAIYRDQGMKNHPTPAGNVPMKQPDALTEKMEQIERIMNNAMD